MSAPAGGPVAFVLRVVARVVAGPRWLGRAVGVATASTASHLLQLVHVTLANDVAQLKDDLLATSRANAVRASAEAQKALAEAVEAENRARLPVRSDALARAAQREALAKARKSEAEARAVEADATLRE